VGFDFITHRRNNKGKVIGLNPYRMKVTKSGTRMERKGEFFHADGSLMDKEFASKFEKKVSKPVVKEAAPVVKEEIPIVKEVPKWHKAEKQEDGVKADGNKEA